MNDMGKNILLWLIIAAVLLTVFNNFSGVSEPQEISYSDFIEQVNRNEIRQVEFDGQHEYLTVLRKDTSRFKVIIPAPDPRLLDDLMEHDVEIVGKEAETEGFWTQLLIASYPDHYSCLHAFYEANAGWSWGPRRSHGVWQK